MTRFCAENGPSNAGSSGGPNSNPELDRLARLNAQMLPPQHGMLETDRHGYPCPPQRLHNGQGISEPTGGRGGGFLHERLPTKNGYWSMPLIKSASPKAVSKNIKTEMAAGANRPQKQAVAIALNTQRQAKKRK